MYLLQANIRFRAELVDLTSARDITLNLATSRTTARSHVDPQASARSRVESQTGIQRKSISLDFVTSARQSKMEGIITCDNKRLIVVSVLVELSLCWFDALCALFHLELFFAPKLPLVE